MIIAITGVKRSGKDTAASYLSTFKVDPVENENENGVVRSSYFIVSRLANPLKRALEEIYGWDQSIWDSPEKEVDDPYWGISPRHAAQVLGTEWSTLLSNKFPEYAKQTGQRTYIKALLRQAVQYPSRNFIISDLRFTYEVEELCDFARTTGAQVAFLRIRRPEAETVEDSHPSEQEILSLDVDTEIINDGSFDELYENLDIFANSLGLKKYL